MMKNSSLFFSCTFITAILSNRIANTSAFVHGCCSYSNIDNKQCSTRLFNDDVRKPQSREARRQTSSSSTYSNNDNGFLTDALYQVVSFTTNTAILIKDQINDFDFADDDNDQEWNNKRRRRKRRRERKQTRTNHSQPNNFYSIYNYTCASKLSDGVDRNTTTQFSGNKKDEMDCVHNSTLTSYKNQSRRKRNRHGFDIKRSEIHRRKYRPYPPQALELSSLSSNLYSISDFVSGSTQNLFSTASEVIYSGGTSAKNFQQKMYENLNKFPNSYSEHAAMYEDDDEFSMLSNFDGRRPSKEIASRIDILRSPYLFGKNSFQKGRMRWNQLLRREKGMHVCTSTLKLLTKTFISLISSLAKWATCEGALPQPIVVLALGLITFYAPRKRLKTCVFIAFVSLRMIAEALYGIKSNRKNRQSFKFEKQQEDGQV